MYLGKTGIGWLSYNRNYLGPENKVCHLYLRYLKQDDGTYEEIIDPNERINVYISQEKRLANDVIDELGSLVSIKFNREPTTYREEDPYLSIRYNPDFQDSEIEIYGFKERGFLQILEIANDFMFIAASKSIESEIPVYTKELLIRTKDAYYGPIEKGDRNQDRIQLAGKKENQYMLDRYNTFDIDNLRMEISDEYGQVQFAFIEKKALTNLQPIDNLIDFIGDEVLIAHLISSLKTTNTIKPYTRNEIRDIRSALSESLLSFNDIKLTEDRKSRLLAILDEIFKYDTFLLSIISYAFETADLFNKLAEKVCNEHFDKIEKRIRDSSKVKDIAVRLDQEIEEKKRRIKELQVDESVITEEVRRRNHEEMQKSEEKIRNLQNTIQVLEHDKDQLQEVLGEGLEVSRLREEKSQLSTELDTIKTEWEHYKRETVLLEEALQKSMADYEYNAMSVLTRQIDRKLFNQIFQPLNSEAVVMQKPAEYSAEETKPAAHPIVPFNTRLLVHLPAGEIIDRISADLQTANRYVTRNEVVNYITCIMQGFITTFAGEPGTGKTSLCTLLAKSLGLARLGEDSRFVDISVERGWTSHKDFIGYYNPLTKTMEKSNNRVFDALYRLKDENAHNCDAPFLILLDEANLSPIEHYWAAFLRLCDADSAYNYSLDLGGKEPWTIPQHLRFLATVNFDHTTEELSPRFLDRSWVITLNPNSINGDILLNGALPNQETIIPYSVLSSLFIPRDDSAINVDAISNKWTKIQGVFKNNNIPIMPRNQKMVQSYCIIGCKYMDMQTMETQFAPLDYAIAQKILPIINGIGDQYKTLLTTLKTVCDGMPLCLGHIERMLKAADENLGFYQFFAK
ncbi:MAG: AAA family ATPase [Treponema sp.]|jgi:hypothetical protein|nr:AAA family ATPase [Treponema sp.]